MKKRMMMMMAAALLGFGTAAAETDYSHYSDDALARLRGTMRNAPVEERAAYHREWQKRLAEIGAEEPMPPMSMPMGKMPNCGMAGMQQQPCVMSSAQNVQMGKLRQKQCMLAATEQAELAKLNQELRSESLGERPDNYKIRQITEKIGRHHTALARLNSSYLVELSSIMTPEQRKNMKMMSDCQPMGGRAGMAGGCGTGMRGGCGMRF